MLMKKFTLFFMSMFLVLGTAMAKDEEKDFNSPEVYPANGSFQNTVWNIRLTFPEAIVVEQSEVNIDVINSKTNKTAIKITSCKVSQYDDHLAEFAFEQIAVEDKGKVEMKDQSLETPGSYSYTIPAGIIKGASGAEFAGGTYTFTIANFFEIADWSPKEAKEAVTELVFTFDKEITDVNLPESGFKCFQNYQYQSPTYLLVKNTTISEDKKSVTFSLETFLTDFGYYDIDIPLGTFISGEEVSMSKSIWFNIVDPTPSFSTNYKDGDKVKVEEFGNFEISFKNVEVVELKQTEFTVLNLTAQSSITGTAAYSEETKKITVTLGQELTQAGDYQFKIPAGMFTMDGVENEARNVNINLYSFTIVPLEIDSVTPKVGTVDQIETIVITFNQLITLSQENWQQISREIALTCGDKEYTLTYNPSSYNVTNKLEYTVNAVWANNAYTCTEPVTIAGEYTLNLADIVVDYAAEDGIDEYGYPAKIYHVKNHQLEGTYTWTVSGNSSVENIPTAEGKQVIYDLLGRRVENITGAGIYIVNGRKVIIK